MLKDQWCQIFANAPNFAPDGVAVGWQAQKELLKRVFESCPALLIAAHLQTTGILLFRIVLSVDPLFVDLTNGFFSQSRPHSIGLLYQNVVTSCGCMIGRLESVDSKVAMASRGSMARASVFSSKSKAPGLGLAGRVKTASHCHSLREGEAKILEMT